MVVFRGEQFVVRRGNQLGLVFRRGVKLVYGHGCQQNSSEWSVEETSLVAVVRDKTSWSW